MPRVTIRGLKESTGVKGFEPLDPGKYVLKCIKVESEESRKSPGENWKFSFQVIEGIGNTAVQKSGKEANGLPYRENVFIMGEAHPKYEAWGHLGVDQLKSMVIAAGIKLQGDEIDPQSFVGKTCIVDMRQREEKDQEGRPVIRNDVREWIKDAKK